MAAPSFILAMRARYNFIPAICTFKLFNSELHFSSCHLLRKRRVWTKESMFRVTNGEKLVSTASKMSVGKRESQDKVSHGQRLSRSDAGKRPSPAPPDKSASADKDADHGNFTQSFSSSSFDRNIPRYDKAGADDRRLRRMMTLAKSRKSREETGKIVLEGRRLIIDALKAGATADTIFFSQVSNVEGLPLFGSKVNLVKVPYKDISLWSDLKTPQGIVGIFRQPSYENISAAHQTDERLPMTLICDNIRDPGNLGTIIRSAAAAACDKILLTKGCVDVWDPKVLRSGTGAHFRIPIISIIPWTSIPNYLHQETRFHVADCNYIPFEEEQDHVRVGQDKSFLEEERHRQSHWMDTNETSTQSCASTPHLDIGNNEAHEGTSLKTVPYFDVNWAVNNPALIIGGETQGPSLEALELCKSTNGRRVYIPMSLGVDSLNAAMATCVILFEAKRQLGNSMRSCT